MRKLGLDIGQKRIGLAISDTTGTIARPLATIERSTFQDEARTIKKYIDEMQVDEVIAGLPIDLRGQKAVAAQNIEKYLEQLEEKLQLPIIRIDERLTTKIADQMLKSAGLKSEKRKKIIDETAAMLILQSYLERVKSEK